MINTFIAALVAIFFFGKTSKDVKEKTQHSSWLRVFLYFTLSFFIGVFLYKTYQVATITNLVSVYGIKTSCDKKGNLTESIDVCVFNNFSSSGIFINNYHNYILSKSSNYDVHKGGFSLNIYTAESADSTIIKYKDKYPGKNGHMLFDDSDIYYSAMYGTTNLPNMIPLYESANDEFLRLDTLDIKYLVQNRNLKDCDDITFKIDDENYKDLPKSMRNGYVSLMYMAKSKINGKYNKYPMSLERVDPALNKMNFFTAADVSKYYMVVSLDINVPINIHYVYNLPIDVLPVPYDTAKVFVGTMGFSIRDNYTKTKIGDGPQSIGFLIKLPTMENLQLIRSLILTTLLTAFVSLFFSNLYFSLRKYFISKRKRLSYSKAKLLSRNRVNRFKYEMYLLYSVLLLLLILYSLFISFDNFILYPSNWYILYLLIPVFAVICIILFIVFRYKRMLKPEIKKNINKEETQIEEIPMIFPKEKSEEEELDELFANHLEDIKKENNKSHDEEDDKT